MTKRAKLTPRDLMRAAQSARGVLCGTQVMTSGATAVAIVVPGPRGVNQANVTPGVALRFAWGVIRAALGAWWANVRGGKRNA